MVRVELEALEVLRKTVTKHGTSGHVYVPKNWIGQTVTVILEVANSLPQGKKQGRER